MCKSHLSSWLPLSKNLLVNHPSHATHCVSVRGNFPGIALHIALAGYVRKSNASTPLGVYLQILHESSVASPPPFRRLEEYDPQPELRRSQVESDLLRVDYALRGEEPDVALRCTFPVFRVVAADQPDRPMLARTMDGE